jgi:hypothetical protein
MYALLRHREGPAVTVREASTFTASLVLAEAFYKFHSFSLECVAFLATWAALSGLIDLGGRLLLKEEPGGCNQQT